MQLSDYTTEKHGTLVRRLLDKSGIRVALISRAAGVSAPTVLNVLDPSKHGTVMPENRMKIRAAIERLLIAFGYQVTADELWVEYDREDQAA